MKALNVLSLFDGMSCGMLALQRAGIPVNRYYASEIDKHAIKVSQHNWLEVEHIGCVTQVKAENLPQIDLLIGGSPCQGFSFAGKQLNFEDPRSKLFFEFVRLLKECKPKYFLLENVKMKKEYEMVITELLGVEPILINSALVSAQNRQRLYWTNITNIEQPEDVGILLKDIVQNVDSEGYNLSEAKVNRVLETQRGKGFFYTEESGKIGTLIAGYHKQPPDGSYLAVMRGKSQTILSTIHKENPKSMCKRNKMGLLVACGAMRGRYVVDGVRQDGKMKTAGLTKQRIEVRYDGKTNALTTVCKDNNVVIEPDGEKYYALDEIQFRKLTPLECERLQTVPDNYTACVSNTQRYKMLGNGWTVDVIAHIFKNIEF